MKKVIIFFYFFIILMFHNSVLSNEKIIRETELVLNIEVPVRVMQKGKLVGNLQKSDFKLFEGGKEQEINGFYRVNKIINNQKIYLDSKRTERFKPRYFVLVLRVTNFTKNLRDAIRKFIKITLRESDRVLIFLNNKTLYFKEISNKETLKSILEKNLQSESLKERFRFEKNILNVVSSLNMARMKTLLSKDSSSGYLIADDVIIFLRDYLRIWREYKKKYLIPDIDSYYNFAKLLEKIDLEKWVITFYQFEKFPEIKFSGRLRNEIIDLIGKLQTSDWGEGVAKSRMISRQLRRIDRELRVSLDFPYEEISKLFYKVNTTFYSLFFTTYNNINSEDFELSEISTDLENTIREITKRTGGELIVSNNLTNSLDQVVKKEDIYYMLTYSPEDSRHKGKIKVLVNNKDYIVLYDNNIRADYINEYIKKKKEVFSIKISNASFKSKELQITLKDIRQVKLDNKISGKVLLHLLINSEDGQKIYNKVKNLITQEDKIEIKVKFDWLKPGKYDLLIDATDMLTGKSTFEYLKLDVKEKEGRQ